MRAIAFVGFLVLNVAASRMRSVHIPRLESVIAIELPGGAKEPWFHTDAGLVYRPARLAAESSALHLSALGRYS
jgi:hypothetical protein